jgi:Rieske Fe-S protein
MKIMLGLMVFTVICTSTMVVRSAQPEDKSRSAGQTQPADAQGTRVTGELTHIEGWHYTIKDSTGQEVSFGVTSDTKDPDKVKEGDHIVAVIGEERIALSIKNMKKKS